MGSMMAVIIGPSPGTNFTISRRYGATFILVGTVGNWRQLEFAMPPNIATEGNRIVGSNQPVEGERTGSSMPSWRDANTQFDPDAGQGTRSFAGTLAQRGMR
jgi:hypothetical protein